MRPRSNSEVEGEVGSLAFGIRYAELKPIISAAGVGETIASWDYESPEGAHVQGSRFMYLLVQAPKGMPCGRVSLDLTADVRPHDKLFPFLTFRQREDAQTPLDIVLWGQ